MCNFFGRLVRFDVLGREGVFFRDGLQPVVDDGVDDGIDNELCEIGRCVVDAEPFPLGRFGHSRLPDGLFLIYVFSEQTSPSNFFEFGDRFLEEMPEDIDVDLVAEIIISHTLEKVRPTIVELKVVNLRIVMKQPAVVARFQVETYMALIDGVKKIEEVAPARVRNFAEGGGL